MNMIDYLRSAPCFSWDPLSWASPQSLRMIFVAGAIVSLVAALFAAYLSHGLMAVPFVCSAGASYLCSNVVERYFLQEQALQQHGAATRSLTAALGRSADQLAESREVAQQREQQNLELVAHIGRLEANFPALSAETQAFTERLQGENRRQAEQIAELGNLVQRLREENTQYEEIRRGFQAQIAAADAVNQTLRSENGALGERLREQQRVNEESRRAAAEAQETLAASFGLAHQLAGVTDRVKGAAAETAVLQQGTQRLGGELLRLRAQIERGDR